jgi:hypothetical protein
VPVLTTGWVACSLHNTTSSALSQDPASVLVALGEVLQVQQLPSSHDQVTDGQPESGQAGWSG